MLDFIDGWLEKITMYRLMLYYLLGLLVIALIESQSGFLNYSPIALVLYSFMFVAICWSANKVFAYVLKAPTNSESSLITGLILALIVSPINSKSSIIFAVLVAIVAMASKYIIAINKKHIFNPAAFGVVSVGLIVNQAATWWVGNPKMLPFVLIGGILITRKIRRERMVTIFIITSLVATTLFTYLTGGDVNLFLQRTVLSFPLFFMAFVMLTEPLTSPTSKRGQNWYAILAGALFPPQVHLASIYSTPQLDLMVSNAFAYLSSPRIKLFLKLESKKKLSTNITNFSFVPDQPIAYLPGQFMEWTLPHKEYDARGDRRYFTLSSSPSEKKLMIGVRFNESGSSYKKTLEALKEGGAISASQLGGDFVMPSDQAVKLMFIAGGVGITPFRSMIKYLLDRNEKRDIVVMYFANNPESFVYKDVLSKARKQLGIKTIYVVSDKNIKYWTGRKGSISVQLIQDSIPDYQQRTFYISGPQTMVKHTKSLLKDELEISRKQIKTDFFSGYS